MPDFDTYVQGGADIRGPKTKTRLKELLKTDPADVYLYNTSQMGPQFSGPATSLPEGTCFNVVGPDPFSRRDWYASVYKGRGGSLVCK